MTLFDLSGPPMGLSRKRIEDAAEDLYTALTTHVMPPELMPHHGAPDGYHWLVLCTTRPQEAHAVLHALYMQVYTTGPLHVPLCTLASLRAYHAAQIVQLRIDPTSFSLPMMWDSYPSAQEWDHLGQRDYDRVKRLLNALELRAAYFGSLASPTALTDALRTARHVLDQYRPTHG